MFKHLALLPVSLVAIFLIAACNPTIYTPALIPDIQYRDQEIIFGPPSHNKESLMPWIKASMAKHPTHTSYIIYHDLHYDTAAKELRATTKSRPE
jgi:hypothetical protein